MKKNNATLVKSKNNHNYVNYTMLICCFTDAQKQQYASSIVFTAFIPRPKTYFNKTFSW